MLLGKSFHSLTKRLLKNIFRDLGELSVIFRISDCSLVSSANNLHMQFFSDRGKPLKNTINSKGPSTESCGKIMTKRASGQVDFHE